MSSEALRRKDLRDTVLRLPALTLYLSVGMLRELDRGMEPRLAGAMVLGLRYRAQGFKPAIAALLASLHEVGKTPGSTPGSRERREIYRAAFRAAQNARVA